METRAAGEIARGLTAGGPGSTVGSRPSGLVRLRGSGPRRLEGGLALVERGRCRDTSFQAKVTE